MDPLLLILNPRDIPECMDAFRALDVPKAYLTGYTEKQLEPLIADLVESTDHTHYVVVSDDVVVTPRALKAVYKRLPIHPVVTGWCNLDDTDHRCSVVDRPLHPPPPTELAYSFMHWSEVLFHPECKFRTWFASMCMTGMSKEMWQRYPFASFGDGGTGFASDFLLSWRLQEDDIPITVIRDGYALHVRRNWKHADGQGEDPRKRLLIGQIERKVTFA